MGQGPVSALLITVTGTPEPRQCLAQSRLQETLAIVISLRTGESHGSDFPWQLLSFSKEIWIIQIIPQSLLNS